MFIAKNELSFDYDFAKEAGGNLTRSSEIKDNIAPGFLPAGYVLGESSADGVSAISRYFNRDGEILTIERFSTGTSNGIDNGNSRTYETEVMGRQALITENPDGNCLFFTTPQYEYRVSADLDAEVLITIAESLE